MEFDRSRQGEVCSDKRGRQADWRGKSNTDRRKLYFIGLSHPRAGTVSGPVLKYNFCLLGKEKIRDIANVG